MKNIFLILTVLIFNFSCQAPNSQDSSDLVSEYGFQGCYTGSNFISNGVYKVSVPEASLSSYLKVLKENPYLTQKTVMTYDGESKTWLSNIQAFSLTPSNPSRVPASKDKLIHNITPGLDEINSLGAQVIDCE